MKINPENKKKNNQPDKKKKQADWKSDIARFLSLGVQITATVFVGILIGHWTDSYLNLDKPVFTLILGLVFSITALYQFIKQFNK